MHSGIIFTDCTRTTISEDDASDVPVAFEDGSFLKHQERVTGRSWLCGPWLGNGHVF